MISSRSRVNPTRLRESIPKSTDGKQHSWCCIALLKQNFKTDYRVGKLKQKTKSLGMLCMKLVKVVKGQEAR